MKKHLYQPTCTGCSHNIYYSNAIPQRMCGVMMYCGEHYCTGGKRARRFKKSDPQIRVPDWCPKRKNPCELRVYALKSTEDWLLHSMLDEGVGKGFEPAARRYALRFEGTTELSPYEFWRRCEVEPVGGLLPVSMRLYEVLEFDDGLKPACFYWKDGTFSLLMSFDAETARKNVLQQDKEFRHEGENRDLQHHRQQHG